MNPQTTLILTDTPEAFRPTADDSTEHHVLYHEKLGVSEVRALVQEVSRTMRTEAESKQLYVCTNFITHEAQNALLKTFEEPPKNTELFLIIPPDVQLLPTLLSRFVATVNITEESAQSTFADFQAETISGRLAMVETVIKKKDIATQRSLKAGLRAYLAAPGEHGGTLTSLLFVAERLLTRGASNKMLLEELALTLPTRR